MTLSRRVPPVSDGALRESEYRREAEPDANVIVRRTGGIPIWEKSEGNSDVERSLLFGGITL